MYNLLGGPFTPWLFKRTVLRRDREALAEGFIAREGGNLAPHSEQNRAMEARFRLSAVRQTP